MSTTFTCNLDAPGSELAHVGSHTLGSGRALLVTMQTRTESAA